MNISGFTNAGAGQRAIVKVQAGGVLSTVIFTGVGENNKPMRYEKFNQSGGLVESGLEVCRVQGEPGSKVDFEFLYHCRRPPTNPEWCGSNAFLIDVDLNFLEFRTQDGGRRTYNDTILKIEYTS